MIVASIREFKAKLSEYLHLAGKGKVILVTRRGSVVAEVRRAKSGGRNGRSIEDLMRSLAARGLVDLPTRRGAIGLRPPAPVRNVKAALDVLSVGLRERKRR
jgi:antitoxin (DNA-binding transcriptional repressor) of toxin-antitoxin stability system